MNMRKAGILVMFAAGLALAACEQGSMEKAGEKVDSAVEEAADGSKDLGDGTAEKAGEEMDKALSEAGNAAEKAADEAGQAIDKAGEKAKAATDGDDRT